MNRVTRERLEKEGKLKDYGKAPTTVKTDKAAASQASGHVPDAVPAPPNATSGGTVEGQPDITLPPSESATAEKESTGEKEKTGDEGGEEEEKPGRRKGGGGRRKGSRATGGQRKKKKAAKKAAKKGGKTN